MKSKRFNNIYSYYFQNSLKIKQKFSFMIMVCRTDEFYSRIEMLKAERDEEEFDRKTSFLPAAPNNEEDLHEG